MLKTDTNEILIKARRRREYKQLFHSNEQGKHFLISGPLPIQADDEQFFKNIEFKKCEHFINETDKKTPIPKKKVAKKEIKIK